MSPAAGDGENAIAAVMTQGYVCRAELAVDQNAGRAQTIWRRISHDLNRRLSNRCCFGDMKNCRPAQGGGWVFRLLPFQNTADDPLIRQASAGNGKTINIVRGEQGLTGNRAGRCFHNAGPNGIFGRSSLLDLTAATVGSIRRRNRKDNAVVSGDGGNIRRDFAQCFVGAFFSRPKSPQEGICVFRMLFDEGPLVSGENPVQKAPVPDFLPVFRQIQIDNIVPDAGQNKLPPFETVVR